MIILRELRSAAILFRFIDFVVKLRPTELLNLVRIRQVIEYRQLNDVIGCMIIKLIITSQYCL